MSRHAFPDNSERRGFGRHLFRRSVQDLFVRSLRDRETEAGSLMEPDSADRPKSEAKPVAYSFVLVVPSTVEPHRERGGRWCVIGREGGRHGEAGRE